MTLSIVIVNFNVKHFILQCLQSVYNAIGCIEAEVFVVDNASSDNSCQAIRERFPKVTIIENHHNVGFSKANNQAIRMATGKYVLLLNPDTVVQEDTFQKCINFMNSHPNAGSMTVKMIDGKGNYLPESKRGFPSPWVSFYKIFGLSALFPRSRKFAQYYLGHLDKNATNKVDILPGAFMFIRHEALDKTGLLDENFFMYGEDIDLSYRLTQNGYSNYYYPDCQIIHYKGESTKKGSLNYVIVFYKAMILFTKKHFNKNARGFIFLINMAIYFKAFLAIIKRAANALWLPLSDILLTLIGFIFLVPLWQQFRFNSLDYYPKNYVHLLITIYIAVWIFSLWIVGAYNKRQKPLTASKGIAIGTVLILAFYSMLPIQMRFSRAIIILGSVIALIATQGTRLIISAFNKNLINWGNSNKHTAIIAHSHEAERVCNLLMNIGANIANVEAYDPNNLNATSNTINTDKIEEYIKINGITEIIFCPVDIPMSSIIKTMLMLSPLGLEFKIAPNDSTTIIGSNSIDSKGELYALEFKTIGTPNNRRKKRVFDISASLLIILTFIIWSIANKHPLKLFVNCLAVIRGKKTWIGYTPNTPYNQLPKLRKGVYSCTKGAGTGSNNVNNGNIYYAKNYRIAFDSKLLWHNLLHEQ